MRSEPSEKVCPVHRRWWIVVVVSVLAVVLYAPAANLLLATRLLVAVKQVADGASGEDLGIVQAKVRRSDRSGEAQALVYRPADALPERAVILVPGISELGCYHPRLMALSRHLAANGFLVLTPDIEPLRRFRMSAETVDQIAFWLRQMPSLDGSSRIRVTGLSGISFSATLAVIAAARPEARDRVSFILGIGAYDDPLRCSRGWFAAGPVTMSPGYYPVRYYARWTIMLGALDLVPSGTERDFLEKALTELLMLRPVPSAPPTLSKAAQRWYRMAIMPEDQADPQLAAEIENHLAAVLYKEISPEHAAGEIRCPVFLIHGAHDDLIPPDESRRLARRFTHAPVHMLVSPFLTHTHPAQQDLHGIRKLRSVFEIAGFFYSLAEVVR